VLVLVSAALALLVAVSDGRSARAAATTNSVTFQDSTGEDASAPDVTSMTVENDDQATLTFTVNIPNRPTLTGDMALLLPIDSDANPSSGSADFGGADYVIELDGPLGGRSSASLFRWDGTDFTATGVSQSTLIFSYANGATIKLNASELGGTRRFGVSVIALSGIVIGADGEPDFTNIRVDLAPDRGSYTYDVKLTPPRLVLGNGGARPVRPAAGKLHTQAVTVARSDGAALQGGSATCRVTVGTARVAAKASALSDGRVSCSYRVPTTGKGKTSRITVTVSSGGLTASRSFSARVV
jgi:hypothetical protein